jgi:hypothetical protein
MLPLDTGKFILTVALFLAFSCNNSAQTNPQKTAKQIQKSLKENSPGDVPTSDNGYYLKAKINGKDWTATGMMPTDKEESKIIAGDNNGESISFHLGMSYVEPGRKKKFSELWIKGLRSPKLTGPMYLYSANTFAIKWEYQDMNCDAFAIFSTNGKGKGKSFKMKGISPSIDFSFDFQDLDLKRVK